MKESGEIKRVKVKSKWSDLAQFVGLRNNQPVILPGCKEPFPANTLFLEGVESIDQETSLAIFHYAKNGWEGIRGYVDFSQFCFE